MTDVKDTAVIVTESVESDIQEIGDFDLLIRPVIQFILPLLLKIETKIKKKRKGNMRQSTQ